MFKIRDIKIYRKFPKKFNMFKIRDIEIYRKFPKKIENHQKFLLQNDRLSRAEVSSGVCRWIEFGNFTMNLLKNPMNFFQLNF